MLKNIWNTLVYFLLLYTHINYIVLLIPVCECVSLSRYLFKLPKVDITNTRIYWNVA